MSDNEDKKNMADLYRYSADKFEKNYYSLRDVEWRQALEFLSGYAAIAAAHYTLNTPDRMKGYVVVFGNGIVLPVLLCGGIVFPVAIWLIYLFFSRCIQRRLRYNRDMQNLYIKKLYESYKAKTLPEEETKRPKFASNWYAFITQMLVHSLFVAGIVCYVVMTR